MGSAMCLQNWDDVVEPDIYETARNTHENILRLEEDKLNEGLFEGYFQHDSVISLVQTDERFERRRSSVTFEIIDETDNRISGAIESNSTKNTDFFESTSSHPDLTPSFGWDTEFVRQSTKRGSLLTTSERKNGVKVEYQDSEKHFMQRVAQKPLSPLPGWIVRRLSDA